MAGYPDVGGAIGGGGCCFCCCCGCGAKSEGCGGASPLMCAARVAAPTGLGTWPRRLLIICCCRIMFCTRC